LDLIVAKDADCLGVSISLLELNCCGVSEPSKVITREYGADVPLVTAVMAVCLVFGVLSMLLVNV
jgi:hypothetical protein